MFHHNGSYLLSWYELKMYVDSDQFQNILSTGGWGCEVSFVWSRMATHCYVYVLYECHPNQEL